MLLSECNIHKLVFGTGIDESSESRYSVRGERYNESILIGESGSVQPREALLGDDAGRPRRRRRTAVYFPAAAGVEVEAAAAGVVADARAFASLL